MQSNGNDFAQQQLKVYTVVPQKQYKVRPFTLKLLILLFGLTQIATLWFTMSLANRKPLSYLCQVTPIGIICMPGEVTLGPVQEAKPPVEKKQAI